MGDSTDNLGNRYPVSLELRVQSSGLTFSKDEWSYMRSELNDHTLLAFQLTASYVFRVTQGSCRIGGILTSQSILFSAIANTGY